MTAPTITRNPHVAAVRTALTAVEQAFDDDERRAGEVALMTAGVALAETVWRHHQWLITADDWLVANKGTISEEDYGARVDRWIARLQAYEAMATVLGEALQIIRLPAPPRPGADTMAQEALL